LKVGGSRPRLKRTNGQLGGCHCLLVVGCLLQAGQKLRSQIKQDSAHGALPRSLQSFQSTTPPIVFRDLFHEQPTIVCVNSGHFPKSAVDNLFLSYMLI
jgi:hypothetical protein